MVWNRVISLVARFHVTFLSGCITDGQPGAGGRNWRHYDVIMLSRCVGWESWAVIIEVQSSLLYNNVYSEDQQFLIVRTWYRQL